MFGKFQFSRINALLNNLGKAGSQTQQVLELAGLSAQQLAESADRELKAATESISGRFTRAFEGLKAQLIPIGEVFTRVGTLILEVGNKILEVFNNLPGPIKGFLQGIMLFVAAVGPLVMIAGVFGNFLGYILKGVSGLMALKTAGRGVFEYFTPESIAAKNSSELITQAIYNEKDAIQILNAAMEKLNATLIQLQTNSSNAGQSMQGMASGALASAERAAASSAGAGQSPIKIFREASKSNIYSGGELSHLTPASMLNKIFDEKEVKYLTSPGTILGAEDMAAKEFQQKIMQERFGQSGYYDPSTGSRSESLLSMSGGQAGGRADLLIGYMSPESQARLHPTMEEHTALVAKNQIALEQLFSKNNEEIREVTAAISSKIKEGDLDGAAKILQSAIDNGDGQLEKLIASRAKEYRDEFQRIVQSNIDSGIDPAEARALAAQELQIGMTTKESETYKQALEEGRLEGTGFGMTGSSGRQGSGLAVAALSPALPMTEELTAASLSRIQAMELVTEQEKKLAETNQSLSRMSTEEISAINKDIDSREVQYALRKKNARGEEKFARMVDLQSKSGYKWTQVTGKVIRTLDLSNTKQANLAAALEKRMIAERRLSVANARLERLKTLEAAASQKSAAADLLEAKSSVTAAQADLKEAAASNAAATASGVAGKGGLGGRMSGGAGMGALGALSMVAMMVPTGSEDSGVSQGLNSGANIAGMVGMGAAVGSVIPGPGTAIGAGLGAAIGVAVEGMGFLSRRAEEAAKEVERLALAADASSGALLDIEKQFLGTDIKELEDLPFQVLGDRTEEAASQLESFTQALIAASAAEENSVEKERVKLLKQMGSGSDLINSSMFMELIGQAIASGTDKDQVKMYWQAYLDAADKESFALAVNNAIDGIMPDGADIADIRANFLEKTANSLNSMVDDMTAGNRTKSMDAAGRLLSEENRLDALRKGGAAMIGDDQVNVTDIISRIMSMSMVDRELIMRGGQSVREVGISSDTGSDAGMYQRLALQQSGLSNLTINGEVVDDAIADNMLSAITSIIEMAPDVQALSADMTKLSENANLMANNLADSLATLDGETFGQLMDSVDLNELSKNEVMLQEFVAQLSKIEGVGPDVAAAFQTMVNSGIDVTTAFKALKLMTAGTNMTIEEIIALSKNKINFDIKYNETFTQTGAPVGTGVLPRPTQGASMPTNALSSAISALGGIDTGGGGSGGSGSSDTSAIEEAYDKQIQKQDDLIEKIKEERAERQKLYNLEKEAFNFSMKEQDLKNQIARARAEGRTAEAAMLQSQLNNTREENKQQEAERRRQEQEDKRIEQAEKRKEALSEAKGIAVDNAKGSSGGGGGGGAGGISQEVADQIKTATMELTSWTNSDAFLKMSAKTGPLSAFFDSNKVKDFRTELEKLGIPARIINDILDGMFDSFILGNEQYGEELEIVRGNLEKVGIVGEDLEDALPNVYAIMIDKGITVQEKLLLIAKEYENVGYGADEAKKKAEQFYEVSNKNVNLQRIKDIAAAYEEVAGKARAAAMETAILNIVTNNPEVDVDEAASAVALDFAKFGAATGGYILGPGTSTSDSIPVRLSNGEYVIKASMVDKYGVPFFNALNQGMLPMMAGGGMVSRYPGAAAGMAAGGYVKPGYALGGLVSGKESEYNINVSVEGSNSSPDDIANKVMQVLQRRDKMSRAGIRI